MTASSFLFLSLTKFLARITQEKKELLLILMSILLIKQDGNEQKRITDSCFSIISVDNSEDKYILECQSSQDATMLIRIFEYITQEVLGKFLTLVLS